MGLDFLIVGHNADGLIVRYVATANAAEAVQQMEQEGLREVQLIEDETVAITRVIAAQDAARAGVAPPPRSDPVKAYHYRHQRLGALPRFLVALQRHQIWLMFAVMLVAFLLLKSWWHLGPVLIGLTASAIVLRLVTVRSELMLTHERILLALRDGRGERAHKTLAAWEKQLDAVKARYAVGNLEIVTFRARALAAIGRRDEALSALEQIRGKLETPEWVYWHRRFLVHAQLLEFGEGREALLKVIEKGPPCASPHLDLALLYALRLRDAAQARLELDRGLQHPLAEAPRLLLPLVEAAVLLEEGQPAAALNRLSRAGPFPPLMALLIQDIDHILRCLVDGALGNRADARRHLVVVEPILIARRDQRMLERCRAAIG